jgi:hypothetical protein
LSGLERVGPDPKPGLEGRWKALCYDHRYYQLQSPQGWNFPSRTPSGLAFMECSSESLLSPAMLDLVQDPLLRDVPLPHNALYFPYGIPTRLHTNSLAVLEAAEASLGRFEQLAAGPELRIDAVCQPGTANAIQSPLYHARNNILTVTGDAESFAVADFASGYGYCRTTDSALRDDPAAFRYFYLDTIAYALSTEAHYAPVHGACVAWEGRGILLCGDPEAGKSTLSYACAKSGFTYVSDDASYLFRRPQPHAMVTGNCHSFRFRPSTARLFPELGAYVAARRPNGKLSIQVDSRHLLPESQVRSCTGVDFLIFLDRRSAATEPRLLPFPKDDAMSRLTPLLRFGRDQSRGEQRQCLQRLVDAVPVYEFRYRALDPAVEALRRLAAGVC